MRLLEALADILRRNDRGQVEYVDHVINALKSGRVDEAYKELNGVNFWGGSGSVFDVVLYEALGPLADKPFILSSDNQALRKTLRDMIDEMARLGIARPPVLDLRNFYRHP